MKATLLFTALFCAAWALPKGQYDLKFKRLYVDPLIPISDIDVPRILNGKEAIPHSIPYQAYLMVSGANGMWLCGGSLISPRYVLTAGHCLHEGIDAMVILGAHNVQVDETSQVRIDSYRLLVHPDFNESTITNDIGIIEFPSAVNIHESINVVRLPSRANTSTTYEGANARASGWGLISGRESASPVLLQVNSTVISNQECDNYFGRVKDNQVCISGHGGVGSCNGDSGGPLVVDNVQIGIDSYGIKDCIPGYPSAYTRTNRFFDWLEENTDLKF